MRTLYDRVFVKVSSTQKTQGGIIFRVDVQEYTPTRICEIVEAGDKCMFLSKGDNVVAKHRELPQLKDISNLPRMEQEYGLILDDKLYMTSEHTFEAVMEEDGTLRPLTNRVLILPHSVNQETKGGLYIPGTIEQKPLSGIVVSVGPGICGYGVEAKEMTVKVGDNVIYGEHSGVEIEMKGVKHMIMKESEIYAIDEDRTQA